MAPKSHQKRETPSSIQYKVRRLLKAPWKVLAAFCLTFFFSKLLIVSTHLGCRDPKNTDFYERRSHVRRGLIITFVWVKSPLIEQEHEVEKLQLKWPRLLVFLCAASAASAAGQHLKKESCERRRDAEKRAPNKPQQMHERPRTWGCVPTYTYYSLLSVPHYYLAESIWQDRSTQK